MSTDPVAEVEQAAVAAPIGPSMVNLPAINPAELQRSVTSQPEPEPQPAAGGPPVSEGAPAAAEPTPAPVVETPGAQPEPAAEGGRSPDLGALLSVVAPGSGHLYLGAQGQQRNVAFGLLAATVGAIVLSYFGFALFLIGLVVWIGAAAYALYDLRAGLSNLREARLTAQMVGWILVIAGGALILSMILPWYRISIEAEGLGGVSGNASGFEVLSIIDIILLVIGAASVVSGLAALGKGPISSSELPSAMPLVIAVGGLVALVLVAFRLFVRPGVFSEGLGGVDVTIGRAPGILLAAACSIAILVAAASALSRPKT
jgi:hypothetical protein